MKLDSAGRLTIKKYVPESEGRRICFYLSWYKRRRRGDEHLRILVELNDIIDDNKKFVGFTKVDNKGRIALKRLIEGVYGDQDLKTINLLIYKERGKVYIEKE